MRSSPRQCGCGGCSSSSSSSRSWSRPAATAADEPGLPELHATTGAGARIVDDARADGAAARHQRQPARRVLRRTDPDLAPTLPLTEDDFAAHRRAGLRRRPPARQLVARSSPTPGAFDEAYVARVREAVGWARAHDLYVVVDMHQDAWGPPSARRAGETCLPGFEPAIGWDGAPAWATITDGLPTCRGAGVARAVAGGGPGVDELLPRPRRHPDRSSSRPGAGWPRAFARRAERRRLGPPQRAATPGLADRHLRARCCSARSTTAPSTRSAPASRPPASHRASGSGSRPCEWSLLGVDPVPLPGFTDRAEPRVRAPRVRRVARHRCVTPDRRGTTSPPQRPPRSRDAVLLGRVGLVRRPGRRRRAPSRRYAARGGPAPGRRRVVELEAGLRRPARDRRPRQRARRDLAVARAHRLPAATSSSASRRRSATVLSARVPARRARAADVVVERPGHRRHDRDRRGPGSDGPRGRARPLGARSRARAAGRHRRAGHRRRGGRRWPAAGACGDGHRLAGGSTCTPAERRHRPTMPTPPMARPCPPPVEPSPSHRCCSCSRRCSSSGGQHCSDGADAVAELSGTGLAGARRRRRPALAHPGPRRARARGLGRAGGQRRGRRASSSPGAIRPTRSCST